MSTTGQSTSTTGQSTSTTGQSGHLNKIVFFYKFFFIHIFFEKYIIFPHNQIEMGNGTVAISPALQRKCVCVKLALLNFKLLN